MVFTYPTSANLGITVDSGEQSLVRTVQSGSPAARAGVRVGDRIVKAEGHRVLTLGDLSRVLEKIPVAGRLALQVQRQQQVIPLRLELANGWRRSKDPSWRESLHMVGPNCGLWGRKLNVKERRRLKLKPEKLALKVTYIWGSHTRRAGIKVGDIIVGLDGQTRDMNIKQLHAHPTLNRNWGDTIPVVLRRNGQDVTVRMTFPKGPPD